MSSLTSDDRVGPNDPEYYAPPRWLRDKPEPRSLRERLAEAEAARASSMTTPGPLDTRLEGAVSKALWHKLDPEVIQDSPQLTSDLARRKALFTGRRPLRSRRRGFGRGGVVLRHHDPGSPAIRQRHACRYRAVGQGDGDPAPCQGRSDKTRGGRIPGDPLGGPELPAGDARAVRRAAATIRSVAPEAGAKPSTLTAKASKGERRCCLMMGPTRPWTRGACEALLRCFW